MSAHFECLCFGAAVLREAVKADHGFNSDSRPFVDLLETLAAFDVDDQRRFLQFVTGSPRLPVGGLRALRPPLTVVRKSNEPPFSADDYLPSAMTCANYLKLPAYSSKAVLAEHLLRAISEGQGSFHLS